MNDLISQFQFWDAVLMTLKLTVISGLISLVLGTLVAIMRLSPVPSLRAIGTAYVTIFRNTPLTLIIFFCSFGLFQTLKVNVASSDLGSSFFTTTNFRLAIIGLAVYHAAFVCEALRSGVNTIPLGQAEAARSIGLTFGQSLREVILPQAFRGAITPLGNTMIALLKNSTVAITIGVAELAYFLAQVNELASDKLNLAFLMTAGIFVLIAVPMGLATSRYAKKWAVQR